MTTFPLTNQSLLAAAITDNPQDQPQAKPVPSTTKLDELFNWIDAQTPPPTIPLSAMDRDEIYCLDKRR